MTDFIRVKNKITGVVTDIPKHYQDFAALFAPWELTDEEAFCTDCEIPEPEVPVEVVSVPDEERPTPVPAPRKAQK